MTKARPSIQIFARCLSAIQWMCPSCGYLHNTKQVDWRQSTGRCAHCKLRYRFGLQLALRPDGVPPYTAKVMGRWDGFTVNRYGDVSNPGAIGRVNGSIQFQCPRCLDCSPTQAPDWDTGRVCCLSCNLPLFVSLLIWRPIHSNLRTPIDCIYPKHGKPAEKPAHLPLLDAEVSAIPGEASPGA